MAILIQNEIYENQWECLELIVGKQFAKNIKFGIGILTQKEVLRKTNT